MDPRTLQTARALALFAATALIGLVGCASPEEIARMDERTCAGYGFAKGSDAFAGCMERVARERRRSADATYNASPAVAGGAVRPATAPTRPAATTTDCKVAESGNSTTTDRSTSNTAGSSNSTGSAGSFSSTTTRSGSSSTTSSSSGSMVCVDR